MVFLYFCPAPTVFNVLVTHQIDKQVFSAPVSNIQDSSKVLGADSNNKDLIITISLFCNCFDLFEERVALLRLLHSRLIEEILINLSLQFYFIRATVSPMSQRFPILISSLMFLLL